MLIKRFHFKHGAGLLQQMVKLQNLIGEKFDTTFNRSDTVNE